MFVANALLIKAQEQIEQGDYEIAYTYLRNSLSIAKNAPREEYWQEIAEKLENRLASRLMNYNRELTVIPDICVKCHNPFYSNEEGVPGIICNTCINESQLTNAS